MRRWAVLVAVTAAAAACDIGFIAVETWPVLIDVSSRHDSVALAAVTVDIPAPEALPRVWIDETEVFGSEEAGRFRVTAMVDVDTLDPRVVVLTDSHGPLAIPFLTRRGPAVHRADGRFELPLIGERADTAATTNWSIRLYDEDDLRLADITSSELLPDPLLVDENLVPAAAVTAEVIVIRRWEIPSALVDPVTAVTVSRIRIPLPPPR